MLKHSHHLKCAAHLGQTWPLKIKKQEENNISSDVILFVSVGGGVKGGGLPHEDFCVGVCLDLGWGDGPVSEKSGKRSIRGWNEWVSLCRCNALL